MCQLKDPNQIALHKIRIKKDTYSKDNIDMIITSAAAMTENSSISQYIITSIYNRTFSKSTCLLIESIFDITRMVNTPSTLTYLLQANAKGPDVNGDSTPNLMNETSLDQGLSGELDHMLRTLGVDTTISIILFLQHL